ncbi:hypothetical protein GVN24_29760 [Rhizobium sp. CRIBSB]|nr:hypothetical protein [Rhizobium sp. CRIBSB]
MISVLFAVLLAAQVQTPPAEEQYRLQSCEMAPEGWVCHYRVPTTPIQARPSTGSSDTAISVPPVIDSSAVAEPRVEPRLEDAEAERQARLILRCANATWLSLCLPHERREAQALKAAADARAGLRADVTRMLGENRCEDAVRTALAGGDLALAREARAFCSP